VDLRLRSRKSSAHEHQSGQRFPWRLGTAVDKIERPTQLRQAAHTGMQRDHRLDIADLQVGRVHQCVDTLDACDEIDTPADVDCGARGGRHAHVADASSLARREVVGVHREHRRGAPVRVYQLGGQVRLDPLRAQSRGG
jgi:hypothetical protein